MLYGATPFAALDDAFGAPPAPSAVTGGTATGLSGYAARMVALAGGWYRCSISARVPLSGLPEFGLHLRLPEAGSVLVWGLQVEQAAAVSSYMPTTAAPANRAADVFSGAAPVLAYCSAPENDYPEWSATGSYATGARVVWPTTHRVYESLIEGNFGFTPTDTEAWVEVRPTNRWAALDASTGTVCTGASGAPLVIAVKPGMADSVCLLDCDAATASLTVVDSTGATLFAGTADLRQRAGGNTWYDWCFGKRTRKGVVVWSDLPMAADATAVVVLDAPESPACGTLVAGRVTQLGDTNYGSHVGIVSFSRKTTSEFGVTTVVPRPYAKRLTIPITIDNSELDSVAAALAEVTDIPVVWVGDAAYSSLVAYGPYQDWGIDVEYRNMSRGSITIQGLT